MSILGIVAAVYIAACGFLYATQRSMLYFPQDLPAAAEPFIQVIDVEGATLNLSARVIDSPQAIIYFGGNGDEVSSELAPFSEAFPGHALYLVHYRGYGGSTGRPTEEALHDDARRVHEMVSRQHPRITVIGRSLGSGIATRLAREQGAERLVLITPYDSVAAVAQRRFPVFPVNLLIHDRFDSLQHAPHISQPTLVIKAASDRVVPHPHTDTLVATFDPRVVELVTIDDTTHNSIWDNPDSLRTIAAFLSAD